MVETDLGIQLATAEVLVTNHPYILIEEVSGWSPDQLASIVVAALVTDYQVDFEPRGKSDIILTITGEPCNYMGFVSKAGELLKYSDQQRF